MTTPDLSTAARCVACARAAVVACDSCGRALCELHVDDRAGIGADSFSSLRQMCVPCSRAEAERSARRRRTEQHVAETWAQTTSPPGRSPLQDALWWGRQLHPVVDGTELVWRSSSTAPVQAVRSGVVLALSKAGLADGDPARIAVALADLLDDAGVLGVDTVPVERRLSAGYRDLQGWLLGPLPGPVRGSRVVPAAMLTRTSILRGRAEWAASGELLPTNGFRTVRGTTSVVVPLVISVARRVAAATAPDASSSGPSDPVTV